jgi:ribosomal protein S1
VVKEGDVVTLRVIRIDGARRRLGLSKRRAQEVYEDSSDDSAEYGDDTEEDGK